MNFIVRKLHLNKAVGKNGSYFSHNKSQSFFKALHDRSQCSHLTVRWPQQAVSGYKVLKTLNEIHLYENLSQPGRNKSSSSNIWGRFAHKAPDSWQQWTSWFRCPSVTSQRDSLTQELLRSQKNLFKRTEVIPWGEGRTQFSLQLISASWCLTNYKGPEQSL